MRLFVCMKAIINNETSWHMLDPSIYTHAKSHQESNTEASERSNLLKRFERINHTKQKTRADTQGPVRFSNNHFLVVWFIAPVRILRHTTHVTNESSSSFPLLEQRSWSFLLCLSFNTKLGHYPPIV